jgi:hypothetical protein
MLVAEVAGQCRQIKALGQQRFTMPPEAHPVLVEAHRAGITSHTLECKLLLIQVVAVAVAVSNILVLLLIDRAVMVAQELL